MIPTPIDAITEDVLHTLITNGVAEGRTIDYKRELPGGTDGDKKEFLADVSSFANTSGGDLVFGVDEDKGVPFAIPGFQSVDPDLEVRRLESIIGSGLEPRIRYAARVITCSKGEKVLVIRVERSWSGPHRVTFKGNDKFYGRNSAGKYPLDVDELRTAFTFSATVTERIRAFRTDRIISLVNNQTPIPFMSSPKIVLHCIPVQSFGSQTEYDVLPVFDNPIRLQPMATSNWDRRLNLDGVLAYGTGKPSTSYVQLYRSGVIEAVEGRILSHEYQGKPTIPSVAYEEYILQYLPRCFQLQREIGASTPIVVAMTLTNVRGLVMGVDSWPFGDNAGNPIDTNTIILPETVVQEFSTPIIAILKPMFDLVWNACGYRASKNFDANGNWITR